MTEAVNLLEMIDEPSSSGSRPRNCGRKVGFWHFCRETGGKLTRIDEFFTKFEEVEDSMKGSLADIARREEAAYLRFSESDSVFNMSYLKSKVINKPCFPMRRRLQIRYLGWKG